MPKLTINYACIADVVPVEPKEGDNQRKNRKVILHVDEEDFFDMLDHVNPKNIIKRLHGDRHAVRHRATEGGSELLTERNYLKLPEIMRWHKEQGDEVEWASPMFHYDVVYMSKVFNFSPDDTTVYQADRIVRGGTGYDIKSQLPDEIDRMQPDYSIYPNVPRDTAYGFLTRGCPNRCPWCVVPRKEGMIRPYMDCDEIAIEGRTKLVLMDNNILAAGDYAKEQMQKIIDRGYRVDFNQALDARLVTAASASAATPTGR